MTVATQPTKEADGSSRPWPACWTPWSGLAVLAAAALACVLAMQGLAWELPWDWLSRSAAASHEHHIHRLIRTTQSRWRQPPDYKPLLPPEALVRGLEYNGFAPRLHKFAAKLALGQPVSVVTVGGSVTAGTGARGREYPKVFFEWLNATFPNPGHHLRNSGMGGASAHVFSVCVDGFVQQDADLVVLEFAYNQIVMYKTSVDSDLEYEQLVRQLLRLPGRPEVAVLHHYAWRKVDPPGGVYSNSAEDGLAVVSRYYETPELSLRRAAYNLMRAGLLQVRANDSLDDPSQRFYADALHPSPVGNQALADLLISMTWHSMRCMEAQAAAGAASRVRACAAGDAAACAAAGAVCVAGADPQTAAAAAMWEEAESGSSSIGAGGSSRSSRSGESSGGSMGSSGPSSSPSSRSFLGSQQEGGGWGAALPPPMVAGNDGRERFGCWLGRAFEAAGESPPGNFSYAPFAPDKPTFVLQKWSWTGTAPGAWVEFVVDSSGEIPGQIPGQIPGDLGEEAAGAAVLGQDSGGSSPAATAQQQQQQQQQGGSREAPEGRRRLQAEAAQQAQQQAQQGGQKEEAAAGGNAASGIPPPVGHSSSGSSSSGSGSSSSGSDDGDSDPGEDITGSSSPPVRPPGTTKVVLGFLKSYEHMGTAEVTCRQGCSCEPSRFTGLWARRASLLMPHTFYVTPHPTCRIRVTVREQTKSDGHKVSLQFISVARNQAE